MSFLGVKRTKNARHTAKIVVYSFCSRVALQHRSAVTNLPLQSCLFRAGCCETRFTRLYKKNYTRVALKQSRTMACSQQGFTFYFWRCRFCFENYTCMRCYCPHVLGGREVCLGGGYRLRCFFAWAGKPRPYSCLRLTASRAVDLLANSLIVFLY